MSDIYSYSDSSDDDMFENDEKKMPLWYNDSESEKYNADEDNGTWTWNTMQTSVLPRFQTAAQELAEKAQTFSEKVQSAVQRRETRVMKEPQEYGVNNDGKPFDKKAIEDLCPIFDSNTRVINKYETLDTLSKYTCVKLLSTKEQNVLTFLVTRHKPKGALSQDSIFKQELILRYYPNSVCVYNGSILDSRPFRHAMTMCSLHGANGFPTFATATVTVHAKKKKETISWVGYGYDGNQKSLQNSWHPTLETTYGMFIVTPKPVGIRLTNLDLASLDPKRVVGIAIGLLARLREAKKRLGANFQHFDFHPDNIYVNLDKCSIIVIANQPHKTYENCPSVSIENFYMTQTAYLEEVFQMDEEQKAKLNQGLYVSGRTINFCLKLVQPSVLASFMNNMKQQPFKHTDIRNWFLIVKCMLAYKKIDDINIETCLTIDGCWHSNVSNLMSIFKKDPEVYKKQEVLNDDDDDDDSQMFVMEDNGIKGTFFKTLFSLISVRSIKDFRNLVYKKTKYYPSQDDWKLKCKIKIAKFKVLVDGGTVSFDYSQVDEMESSISFDGTDPEITLTFKNPLVFRFNPASVANVAIQIYLLARFFTGIDITDVLGVVKPKGICSQIVSETKQTSWWQQFKTKFSSQMSIKGATITMQSHATLLVIKFEDISTFVNLLTNLVEITGRLTYNKQNNTLTIKIPKTHNANPCSWEAYPKHCAVETCALKTFDMVEAARAYKNDNTTLLKTIEKQLNKYKDKVKDVDEHNIINSLFSSHNEEKKEMMILNQWLKSLSSSSSSANTMSDMKLSEEKLVELINLPPIHLVSQLTHDCARHVVETMKKDPKYCGPSSEEKDLFNVIHQYREGKVQREKLRSFPFAQTEEMEDKDTEQAQKKKKELKRRLRLTSDCDRNKGCSRHIFDMLTIFFHCSQLVDAGTLLEDYDKLLKYEGLWLENKTNDEKQKVSVKLTFNASSRFTPIIDMIKYHSFSFESLRFMMNMFGVTPMNIVKTLLPILMPEQFQVLTSFASKEKHWTADLVKTNLVELLHSHDDKHFDTIADVLNHVSPKLQQYQNVVNIMGEESNSVFAGS